MSDGEVEMTVQEAALYRSQQYLSKRDGLGVGVAGAHRTGKTSVCERLTERNPMFPFVRTSTREMARRYGFDVNNPGSFKERLDFQECVLAEYEELYEAQSGCFFTDRTPYDLAAYLLSEVPTGQINPNIDARVTRYVDRCIDLANRHFSLIVVIQPGIPHVPAPGVPAPNRAYQEKLNAIICGLSQATFHRRAYMLDRGMTDFQKRVNAIAGMTGDYLSHYFSVLNNLPRH